jgi:hypothetical protein
MKKFRYNNDGEGHNFWQNYTDLMAGFLIVFILISVVAWTRYTNVIGDEAEMGDIKVTLEQLRKIKEFEEAQRQLKSNYFNYNEQYQRYECTVDVLFAQNDEEIPNESISDLINAGKELELIIDKFNKSVDIAFKVIIEGRAARHLNKGSKAENDAADAKVWAYAETLSYNRARNLYNLWEKNGILDGIEKINGEVFISGSGFGGQGRHSGGAEDKNKTFIIQIIPYIK